MQRLSARRYLDMAASRLAPYGSAPAGRRCNSGLCCSRRRMSRPAGMSPSCSACGSRAASCADKRALPRCGARRWQMCERLHGIPGEGACLYSECPQPRTRRRHAHHHQATCCRSTPPRQRATVSHNVAPGGQGSHRTCRRPRSSQRHQGRQGTSRLRSHVTSTSVCRHRTQGS